MKKLTYEFVKSEIEKDGYQLLSTKYKNTYTKLKIKCDKGHEYLVQFYSFRNGHRCPYCFNMVRGQSYRMDYYFVKEQIEKEGYQLLSQSYQNANSKIKISCDNGHIYEVKYNSFQQGHRCSKCAIIKSADNQRFSYHFIKQEIEKVGYKLLSDEYESANSYIMVQCDNGHIYEVKYNSFQQGHRCPKCCNQGTSNVEKELQDWLSGHITIERNKRFYYNDGKKWHEADIYIPSKNIVIEFDGLYYHSELAGKDKNYHLRKTTFFTEQDIQLIHVFENEWCLKQDIVKSIILNKIGLTPHKVFARNCIVKELSTVDAKTFLNDGHIQGYVGASVKLGLVNKKTDEIVAVVTFSKPRFSQKYDWELSRFCNRINTSVVGGFSKLLKYFCNQYSTIGQSLVSYADCRYSNGNLYKVNGFELINMAKPNYFYFKNGLKLESRVKYQKHKLSKKLEIFDPSLTEWDNMQNNGYNRIFDCGNFVFFLKNEYNSIVAEE